MPDSTALDIPYERQTDLMSNRMCGAAALCMVYRSFQVSCTQAELAIRLTRPGPTGYMGIRTNLLAQDALARGLSALVLRARDPLRSLKACHQRQLRVILNHRLYLGSPSGHFTVLVDFKGEVVIVHDPQAGPNTRLLQSDLLKLWRPGGGIAEITGNVLIVLAKGPQPAGPCPRCGGVVPDAVACAGCEQLIPLQPAAVLGCMNPSCPERAWESLFCPQCDAELLAAPAKEVRGPAAAPASEPAAVPAPKPDGSRPPPAAPAAPDSDPLKILALSQQIDQFLELMVAGSKGRRLPGLDKQIATIRQLQAEMLDLQNKGTAAPPLPEPSLPPAPAAAQPPPRPPRPPVDWDALSRQLVEESGRRPG
jgi:hypothetical protein